MPLWQALLTLMCLQFWVDVVETGAPIDMNKFKGEYEGQSGCGHDIKKDGWQYQLHNDTIPYRRREWALDMVWIPPEEFDPYSEGVLNSLQPCSVHGSVHPDLLHSPLPPHTHSGPGPHPCPHHQHEKGQTTSCTSLSQSISIIRNIAAASSPCLLTQRARFIRQNQKRIWLTSLASATSTQANGLPSPYK